MGTISLTTTRTGLGDSSTIKITTSNDPSWTTGTFKPSSTSELAAAKEAIWQEVLKQMLAL